MSFFKYLKNKYEPSQFDEELSHWIGVLKFGNKLTKKQMARVNSLAKMEQGLRKMYEQNEKR